MASSAEPAAAGIFCLDLLTVLKIFATIATQLEHTFSSEMSPSLIEEYVGRLGVDRLLVGLRDAAVVKVVPVAIILVDGIRGVYKNMIMIKIFSPLSAVYSQWPPPMPP